jgi:signal transduction histidine kinase/AmiR/NasT family two-component response regulator/HPt (histidine-containing phosphotransfer) domain-containing protein
MFERLRQRLIDLPIRKKLMLIITVTAVTVLVISTLAFVANEIVDTWHSSLKDLSTTAQIIGSNSTAALAFNDEAAGIDILGALRSSRWIESACLYDAKGAVFARYSRAGAARKPAMRPREVSGISPFPEGSSQRSFRSGWHLHLVREIVVDGERVGAILIIKDMREINANIARYLAIAGAIIALSGMVAVYLASRFHTVVSRPVAGMMDTMTKVAATGDYSMRTEKLGNDELGCLADGFNEMLRRTEEGTSALEIAKSQAEAASRAKSLFLANMSHEVRTPLNGIVGILKLMEATPLNEKQLRYVDVAITASDTLLCVINDILDFSKIEAGRLELESMNFSVLDLVGRVVQMFADRTSQKGIELLVFPHPELPDRVRGDPNRLAQVLINLVGNAIKFTETGSVTIRVFLEAGGAEHAMLRFTVTDTGIGISEEQKRRLFQAFSQGDASTTRRFGGTGLGLAICKNIVELMEGSIGVESVPGAGSTFWFTVKLEMRNDSTVLRESEHPGALHASADGNNAPEQGRSAEMPRDTGAPARGGRILLAEDNDINQMLVLEILRIAEHECDCVANGWAAVAAFQTGRYDLVLMDCQMPEMDGYAATRAIRAWESTHPRETRARRIPIIALTAHALAGDREACLESGMDDYLSKPLDPAVLLALIDGWLNRSRPAQQNECDAPSRIPPREPDDVAVDYDALVDRCMGNVPLAQRLVAKFRTQVEADLNALRDAIACEDRDRIAFHAHRMKGAAANLSAEGIRSAAAAIELKAKGGGMGDMAQTFDALDMQIHHLREYAPPELPRAAV